MTYFLRLLIRTGDPSATEQELTELGRLSDREWEQLAERCRAADPLSLLPEPDKTVLARLINEHGRELRAALGDTPGDLGRARELIVQAAEELAQIRAVPNSEELARREGLLQTEIRRLSTERNRLRKQSLPTVSTEDLENAIFERRYVLDQLRSIHVVGRRHGSGGSLPLPVLRLLAEAFREATSEEPRQHRDRGQRFFCFVEVFATGTGVKDPNLRQTIYRALKP